jgi:hypothetical protein
VQTCKVKKCDREAFATGYCGKHYSRFYRHGRTDYVAAHSRKGASAETNVMQIFRSAGHEVEKLKQADGDFRAGDMVIEVKCAERRFDGGVPCWKFNIHRHGALNEHCDYYVLQFDKVPYHRNSIHAAFKAPLGKLTLDFSLRKMISELAPAVQLFRDLVEKRVDRQTE